MPDRNPRQAEMSRRDAVSLMTSLIKDIENTPDLQALAFGVSVRQGLIGMRARLNDQAFFSVGMEKTLTNWAKAIQKFQRRICPSLTGLPLNPYHLSQSCPPSIQWRSRCE